MREQRWAAFGWETVLLDAWRSAGYRYREAARLPFLELLQILALHKD